MNTIKSQENSPENASGPILAEIGEGWKRAGDGRWESPGGELYVGVDLSNGPDVHREWIETEKPQPNR